MDSTRDWTVLMSGTEANQLIVPLNCYQCGGPIEVACELTDAAAGQSVRFRCPYCETPREFDAPGQVMWVAARPPGEGPETRH